jgi:hypothetical protein
MRRRHPHSLRPRSSGTVGNAEAAGRPTRGLRRSAGHAAQTFSWPNRLQQRAASVGFELAGHHRPAEKVREELVEVEQEIEKFSTDAAISSPDPNTPVEPPGAMWTKSAISFFAVVTWRGRPTCSPPRTGPGQSQVPATI